MWRWRVVHGTALIVITKRHLKIIPSTFGTIFRRKNYHKWPDGAYNTQATQYYHANELIMKLTKLLINYL